MAPGVLVQLLVTGVPRPGSGPFSRNRKPEANNAVDQPERPDPVIFNPVSSNSNIFCKTIIFTGGAT